MGEGLPVPPCMPSHPPFQLLNFLRCSSMQEMLRLLQKENSTSNCPQLQVKKKQTLQIECFGGSEVRTSSEIRLQTKSTELRVNRRAFEYTSAQSKRMEVALTLLKPKVRLKNLFPTSEKTHCLCTTKTPAFYYSG